MSSIEWNGADGLPPLDDDDNNRRFWRDLLAPLRSGKWQKWQMPLGGIGGFTRCSTPGCAQVAERDMPFCAVCNLRHLRDAIYNDDADSAYPELPGWPDRRPAFVTLPEPVTPPPTQQRPVGRPEREMRLPHTYGAEAMTPTMLDDQCPYCRAVLIEWDEPIPSLREETCRALQGFGPVYVCPRHTTRRVAHAETLKRINDLLACGLTSYQIGLKFERAGGGYLNMNLADDQDNND